MPEEHFSEVLGLLRLTLAKKRISKYLKILEICAPTHCTDASWAQWCVCHVLQGRAGGHQEFVTRTYSGGYWRTLQSE